MDARTGRRLLAIFGWWNIAFAVLHAVIIAVGGPGYRYFGAGEEMARAAEAGKAHPTVVTAGLTFTFAFFALYVFSAAGYVRHLPLAKYVVAAIGVLYLLRGILIAPQAVWLYRHAGALPVRFLVFSGVALVLGVMCLQGVALIWKDAESVAVRAA